MNLSETCYDSDLFESEQLNGLTCPIGLGVLKNPVFDACGHVFCYGCITDWLKKQKLCPINKQPLNENQLIKAIPIKNMIDDLVLKQCLQKCEWKGKLDQYYNHVEKECQEKEILCKNEGCQQQIKRKNLQNHLENECQFSEVKCINCDKLFTKANIESHQEVCEERLIQCLECKENIKFIEKNNHKNQCKERKIDCPIEGCNEKIKWIDLDSHISNKNHILLLQQQVSQLKELLATQQQQLTDDEIPYLDGWRTTFSKKEESREWNSINSKFRIRGSFCLHFEAIKINKRPNQWRAVIGVSKDRLQNNHLWYRQKHSYVWIFGGFKCSTQAEVYGNEVQDESFQGKMILNSKGELSFEYKGNDLGVAFVIPQNVSQDGLYLIISFVNVGKIRLLNIFH